MRNRDLLEDRFATGRLDEVRNRDRKSEREPHPGMGSMIG
jgi:hypothetical protein